MINKELKEEKSIQRNVEYITTIITIEDFNLIKFAIIINNEISEKNKTKNYGSSFLLENQQLF